MSFQSQTYNEFDRRFRLPYLTGLAEDKGQPAGESIPTAEEIEAARQAAEAARQAAEGENGSFFTDDVNIFGAKVPTWALLLLGAGVTWYILSD